MSELEYGGGELGLFAAVANWKAYWASRCKPHIRGDVLEVGAGMGSSTAQMIDVAHTSWTCLEPDPRLAQQLEARAANDVRLNGCRVIVGTTADLAGDPSYDTLVYVDVLEHIADDRGELARAAGLLRPGGKVVVVAPALQLLYSPFDRAIGHYRRYRRRDLARLRVANLEPAHCEYLDSVGMAAAFLNRCLLRQSLPTARQLAVWDRLIIPSSVVVDRLFGRCIGKSILFVLERSR